MQRFVLPLLIIVLFLAVGPTAGPGVAAEGERPLQPLIDAAGDNAVVTLEPGRYAGPVVIDKPIFLDGGGAAIIDGGGKGTVITIDTDGATVRGVTVVNSGDSHNDIDAGIRIAGNFNVVKDNVIRECLFGIDLQQADRNIVRRNRISSKSDADLGVKGDALRLWYSRENRIENNIISGSRDFVVWYSADNRITGNGIREGRYGIHFMYSRYNLVEKNTLDRNAVGIFLMYSDDVVVRDNRIFQALGTTGIGVGLKETSNVEITDNEILYNATGIYLDLSPFEPDTTNRIYRNRIAFNETGILFLNDWVGNLVRDNIFSGNIRQVSVTTFASAARNEWRGNYWDDYEGFDSNHDGIGDTAYRPMIYADRIWMDVPPTAFFKGTPILTVIDFLERLAPFSEPMVLLVDEEPRTRQVFEPATKRERADEGSERRIDPFGLDEN